MAELCQPGEIHGGAARAGGGGGDHGANISMEVDASS
jgi:hypothetical protein